MVIIGEPEMKRYTKIYNKLIENFKNEGGYKNVNN
jgi:hypothetical protein